MARPAPRTWLAAAGAVCFALMAGCAGPVDRAGGAREPHHVVLHVLNMRNDIEAQDFAKRLAELSKGSLTLSLENKWPDSITGEADPVRAVQAGRADLAIVPARVWHGLGVTSFDALIAPMAVDSYALQRRVLGSDIPAQMLKGLDRLGLQGVGILPGGMRKPAGITRVLLTAANFTAARIAISPSAVADRSLRELGAVPVASTFEGTSLHGFDGAEQPVSSIFGNQHDGVVHTVTANVNLWPRPLVVFGSVRALGALSGTQSGWLRAAVRDTLDATTNVNIEFDAEGEEAFCRRGALAFVDASSAQLAQLRLAFAPALAWLRQDRQTSQFLDRIAGLRAGVSPFAKERLSCPDGTPSPSGSPRALPPAARTVLDGVYEADITRSDLKAAGSDPTGLFPANWGHFVFVFDRGRFAFTQRAGSAACTWGYGTITVSAGQLELAFIDGGSGLPKWPANKPGELFDYRWSRYRDFVTWSAVPGAASPLSWMIRPWHLISADPSARFLDQHCPPPATALSG